MKTMKITLKSIVDVKEFVNLVAKCDYEVDIISGRYVVDAKSIMGIFSLDLANELTLQAYTDDASSLFDRLKKFQ